MKELAELWHFSVATITKLFENEQGVICLENDNGKRRYRSLSIPESVAQRVHERLSAAAGPLPIKKLAKPGRPTKIIRIRDLK